MNNQKTYTVGAVVPSCCDQAYLRDRDEQITASSEQEAIQLYLANHGQWLHDNERKYISIVR